MARGPFHLPSETSDMYDSRGNAFAFDPRDRAGDDLLRAAYDGDLEAAKTALAQGAEVTKRDEQTGLCPLHLAIGTNNLALARYLIEEANAPIVPDGFGRWPTVIAAECCAGEELCDYIVEKEAAALAAAK